MPQDEDVHPRSVLEATAIPKLAKALRETLVRLGLGLTMVYAVHRLLQRVSRGRMGLVCYGLYAQPIGGGQYVSIRDDSATSVTRAFPDENIVAAFPRPGAVIEQRFRQGARCYVATVKGDFAGYIWLIQGSYDEDEVRCRYRLPDGAATVWDFDVYVEPRLRMGRTLARLWKAADTRLVEDGVHWSFSRISWFNRESTRTHKRLGAVCVGHVMFVCVGPAQVALLGHPPFLHFSYGPDPGPTIRLKQPS